MAVEITVGPPVLTINRGQTFVVTDHSGEIHPNRAQGVFAHDTRFVSDYRLWINGQSWERVSSAGVSHHTARHYLVNPEVIGAGISPPSIAPYGNPPLSGASGLGPTHTIPYANVGLQLVRCVSPSRIEESFEITYYGQGEAEIAFAIELMSDFADIFEVKASQLRQRDNVASRWDDDSRQLVTTYQKEDYARCFAYRIVDDQIPSFSNGRLVFSICLRPRRVWQARAEMLLLTQDEVPRDSRFWVPKPGAESRAADLHEQWVSNATSLRTSHRDLEQAYNQSIEDMGALRLFERDIGPDVWLPAGGIPWYAALFGRDSLIASLQTLPVHVRFAEGTLRVLAEHQAQSRDDWRDAQPGKILHEYRNGELSHFRLIPHNPYYGTWDATPLYLVALHEAWTWLGDRKLLEELRPVAEGCLKWIDESGDLDGDGFQEYQTYSSQGYENMSWKDAHDAVVYPDGSQVKQPKAICELQGYVYAAKRGMAEIFRALGEAERARELESQAAELKERFNRAFWMEDEGTYAFALDPEKRQVKSVVSNAGHCLWARIADPDKAQRVAKRLLAPDMWSGWGIRTLSANNPAYNPHSYQRGSVWPHDNGIAALGLKRYGLADEANQIASGILGAAARFLAHRLPETFAGLPGDPSTFPVQYRGANTPQAWSAGSIFHLVRAMLGLRADAPNGRLWVDPTLPDWAPTLELANLRVGQARVGLRFWREGAATRFEVTSLDGGQLDVRAGPA